MLCCAALSARPRPVCLAPASLLARPGWVRVVGLLLRECVDASVPAHVVCRGQGRRRWSEPSGCACFVMRFCKFQRPPPRLQLRLYRRWVGEARACSSSSRVHAGHQGSSEADLDVEAAWTAGAWVSPGGAPMRSWWPTRDCTRRERQPGSGCAAPRASGTAEPRGSIPTCQSLGSGNSERYPAARFSLRPSAAEMRP